MWWAGCVAVQPLPLHSLDYSALLCVSTSYSKATVPHTFTAMLHHLQAELDQLDQLATRIREEGDAIQSPDFWLDTARNKTGKQYYRKRWFDEAGRKRTKSISESDYKAIAAAIDRGKQLEAIEDGMQWVERLVRELEREVMGTIERVRELGGMV